MTFATIILIIITSAGIFGFLSNAYQGATVEFEKESTNLIFKEDRLKQLEEDKQYLKEELHEGNSYIQAKSEFKYSFYRRYWVMIPYRLVNEFTRLIYKLCLFIKIKIES